MAMKKGDRIPDSNMYRDFCRQCDCAIAVAQDLVGRGRLCSDCMWDGANTQECPKDSLTLRQRYGKGKTSGG